MHRWNISIQPPVTAIILLIFATAALGQRKAEPSRERLIRIASQIQRADYEGDRTALKRLYTDLAPFVENKDLASRVRYWRGFALWRRAVNGFNDKVDPTELQEDLTQAVAEFDKALQKDPVFLDAKIGSLSCLGFLAFSIRQQDPGNARIQELIAQTRQLWRSAQADAPDNPRLLWVVGPMIWNTSSDRGGGQAKAIEGYEKGLETIRGHKEPVRDRLEPSWGEPELLMSLAWAKLNQATPDLSAAEREARSALDLVPYWHYVRDILMPQIREAKRKAALKNPDGPE